MLQHVMQHVRWTQQTGFFLYNLEDEAFWYGFRGYWSVTWSIMEQSTIVIPCIDLTDYVCYLTALSVLRPYSALEECYRLGKGIVLKWAAESQWTYVQKSVPADIMAELLCSLQHLCMWFRWFAARLSALRHTEMCNLTKILHFSRVFWHILYTLP
jgi:hypothetical protein